MSTNSQTVGSAAAQTIVMRQRWRDLLFLHWRVPASDVQRHLPPGLVVDTFAGDAYIGLVPFTMRDVAPAFLAPVPLVSDLLECNVRTYVRRAGGTAPGVWFFSLDASGPLAVLAARIFFALPYFLAEMRQDEQRDWRQLTGAGGGWLRRIDYRSSRRHPGSPPAECRIEYSLPSGPAAHAAPGTLEQFLLERYTLYAFRRGQLLFGQVHHEPYLIEPAKLLHLRESFIESAGFVRPPEQPLVHYSREVIVNVSPLVACR